RAFLNNVVAGTIVFENGTVKEYAGGYDDWLRQRPARDDAPRDDSTSTDAATAKPSRPTKDTDGRKRKLSFKENQELQSVTAEIERLETEIDVLHRDMAQPEFYQRPGDEIAAEHLRLKTAEDQLT